MSEKNHDCGSAQLAENAPKTVNKDSDIIYTLRTSHQTQTQMLMLADQKANILIGIVAVMLTIILTNHAFLARLDTRFLPLFAGFVFMEVAALIIALLVVTPRRRGKMTGHRAEKLPNPLFFGHFTQVTEDEYFDFLYKRLVDDGAARELLIRDIYNHGLVLKKKYTSLKYAYSVAIFGIILLALYGLLFVLSGLATS